MTEKLKKYVSGCHVLLDTQNYMLLEKTLEKLRKTSLHAIHAMVQ
jgi:hypothetical protein